MSDPVTIKILILSDGRLRDDSSKFGLNRLARILQEDWGSQFRFHVSRKYIEDYGKENLRMILDKTLYQEAWLFGDFLPFGGTSPRPEEKPAQRALVRDELDHLSEFMTSAGVFATGDHKDLGGALNGNTVRISKMRKWFFRTDRPDPLNAPPRNGSRRHDTLRNPAGAGSHSSYLSKFQEDDVPQVIEPTLFATSQHSALPLYPHPLLSSPTGGVISLLPDHMHEGECYVSSDLPVTEFPSSRRGVRPLPVIVAKSKIEESHPTTDNYPSGTLYDSSRNITDPRGLICAYDGHPVLNGRAVADSTFHHFLDLNLRSFAESRDGTSRDRGQNAYEQIKTYYRNIALWLAPPQYQQRIFERVLLDVISEVELRSSTSRQWADLLSVGSAIRVLAGRLVSSSFVLQWMLELVNEVGGEDVSALLVNPWLPQTGGLFQGLLDTEVVISALVGGVALSLADSVGNEQSTEIAGRDSKTRAAIRKGVEQVVKQFMSAAAVCSSSQVGSLLAESGRTESSPTSHQRDARYDAEGSSASVADRKHVIVKGDCAMSTIWYDGEWKLEMPTGDVWTIRIFLVRVKNDEKPKPYVQLAPCNAPDKKECDYTSPTVVLGPNPAPLSDVSISFCTTLADYPFCFMIDFYYREDEDYQRLRYRYLKLEYPARKADRVVAISDVELEEDGSGTGTRPPATKVITETIAVGTDTGIRPPTAAPPVVAAARPSVAIDDGSGTGTRPPTTVEQ